MQVQPSDLLNQKEVDKLLGACRHPRNKAFIAVMLDSGLDGIAFDVVGDAGTLRRVYGLDVTEDDYSKSLQAISDAGINIAQPTRSFVKYARAEGYVIEYLGTCCGVLPQDSTHIYGDLHLK